MSAGLGRAPAPSDDEAAVIERFGMFAEEERVEKVARALWIADRMSPDTWDLPGNAYRRRYLRLAAAAVAALGESPAEEAAVEDLSAEGHGFVSVGTSDNGPFLLCCDPGADVWPENCPTHGADNRRHPARPSGRRTALDVALSAMPPHPAEEAVRRVEAWAEQLGTEAALISAIGHQRDVAAAKRDAADGIRAALDGPR